MKEKSLRQKISETVDSVFTSASRKSRKRLVDALQKRVSRHVTKNNSITTV